MNTKNKNLRFSLFLLMMFGVANLLTSSLFAQSNCGNDSVKPTIYLNASVINTLGIQGITSSKTPYLQSLKAGVYFKSLMSVPDTINGYRMVGIPDGLGAYDNNDGTFTLLMNHELGSDKGIARAHGAIGSFVSKWIIRKSDLAVLSGSDLMKQVYGWNVGTQSSNTTTSTIAFNRFCSADLPSKSAFYNATTGKGSLERIFMHGEEGSATGYQLATVATGADSGKAYILGKFNLTTNGSGLTGVGAWENALACPYAQDKTIVVGPSDGGTGIMNNSVPVYIGTKQNTGSEVDKAGLTNGIVRFVKVVGNPTESVNATTHATNITNGTAFVLDDDSSTVFLRPEDGAWDPNDASKFYFATTDRLDSVMDFNRGQIGRSRLWRLNFTDIANPELGGTIDMLLDGTEGANMMDNFGIDKLGHIFLQEDVGNADHNGKIWQYTIATDQLELIAKHDISRFGNVVNGTVTAATSPYNKDEESSGMIDMSDILGAGWHILVDQSHSTTGLSTEVVEHGQLLAAFIPASVSNTAATANDTVRVYATGTTNTVSLGTPATGDNCSVASVTNNAPATFPIGTTNVLWTVTDASGNTNTATQVVIVTDTTKPSITAPSAISTITTNGCNAQAVNLGTPSTNDYSLVIVTNNAPSLFPVGTTTVTWTATDASGNVSTATQLVTVVDNVKPTIYLNSSVVNTLGIKGSTSSKTPYLQSLKAGVYFKSLMSVPDTINGYRMVGIPDGLGAYDNNDGTFTLLMNHELGSDKGIARAHGAIGSFVSKWIIRKSDLAVLSGSDLMKQVYGWNVGTQSSNTTTSTIAFNRFCSADLPSKSAFYNATTGKGSLERIFMHGEEGSATGYQLATVATGADSGKAYILGKFNLTTNGSGLTGVGAWENALACPYAQDKTIVVGPSDGGTGIMNNSVPVYIGTKQNTGSEVDKAGLTNGIVRFVKVVGNPTESVNATTHATNITNGTAFVLDDDSSTVFLRPEDGAWDPNDASKFYFATTDRLDSVMDFNRGQIGRSRLWRLNFTDIANPELGGTIDMLLDGTEGANMMDNFGIDKLGHIFLQEDVGNADHNGKIWQYTIATDQLELIAKHDISRFGNVVNGTVTAATSPYNKDEESSGMIDMSDILGAGWHILVDQSHSTTGLSTEVVEHGQLLAAFIPASVSNTAATANDTVRVYATGTTNTVSLGTPATGDNCSVASVTNNAPATFPIGTTNVLWTVTDASGNTNTATQVVIVTDTTAPVVTTASACNSYVWSANGQTYTASTVDTFVTSGCATKILRLTIYSGSVPSLGAVTGTSNVCPFVGSASTTTYTVAPVSGASSYNWVVPPYVNLVSGQGTNTITVSFTSDFISPGSPNKQVRVNAVSPCGNGAVKVFYLTATKPTTPSVITPSTTNVCPSIGTSTAVVYKINKVASTQSYVWELLTSGAPATSATLTNLYNGANDTAVSITFASNFTTSILSVYAVNDCGTSVNARTITITRVNPSTPGLISGPRNACEYAGSTGGVATYSISAVNNAASYTWTIPVGATNVTGQGTTSISFKFPAGYTTGAVSVIATNGCGSSNVRSMNVTSLNATTPGIIDVINLTTCPSRTYSYTIGSLPSTATSLVWNAPVGGTIVSGQGTTSIVVSYAANASIDGYVYVQSVNNCSLSYARSSKVKLSACAADLVANNNPLTKGAMSTNDMKVKIYPNPSTTSFNLQALTNVNGSIAVKVMDIQGRTIKTMNMIANETINFGAELRAGSYMVELNQAGVIKTVRVIKF